jgi:hypothetical protein
MRCVGNKGYSSNKLNSVHVMEITSLSDHLYALAIPVQPDEAIAPVSGETQRNLAADNVIRTDLPAPRSRMMPTAARPKPRRKRPWFSAQRASSQTLTT